VNAANAAETRVRFNAGTISKPPEENFFRRFWYPEEAACPVRNVQASRTERGTAAADEDRRNGAPGTQRSRRGIVCYPLKIPGRGFHMIAYGVPAGAPAEAGVRRRKREEKEKENGIQML
jgi:hypothetical protein